MTEQAGSWAEWSEQVHRRVGWAERRLQSLQDHTIEWSTWAYRNSDALANMQVDVESLREEMAEIKDDLRKQHQIWVGVARHIGLSFDDDNEDAN